MAKVNVRRTTTYSIEHEDREFEVEFQPADYHDPIIKTLDDGRVVIGYLSDDPDPSNPRDNDNLGVMVCWHSRYSLGDEHSYENPDALWRDLIGDEEFDAIEEKYNAETEKWHADHPDERYGGTAHMKWIDDVLKRQNEEVRAKVLEKHTVLPLHLYDHSGITMSTSGFSCPWDSGQVGYIYVSHEKAMENWSVPSMETPVDYKDGTPPKPASERAIDLLKGEVEEYDHYLTNDCWGVCVEVFEKDGERVEDDACWGHLGSDWAEQALSDEVESTVKHLLKKDDDQPA